ncbi:hypothetical protein CRG98_045902 [Punica granatum]|uniref:Uncharacterized protein n=1 Tax=Punica granatum TaxID=22663 RepID=A0A2I0HQF9_PUNGR|nr:hypothetical protein CRG98_045902 [Punica granatum]
MPARYRQHREVAIIDPRFLQAHPPPIGPGRALLPFSPAMSFFVFVIWSSSQGVADRVLEEIEHKFGASEFEMRIPGLI